MVDFDKIQNEKSVAEQNSSTELTEKTGQQTLFPYFTDKSVLDAITSQRHFGSQIVGRSEKKGIKLKAERYNFLLFFLEEDLSEVEVSAKMVILHDKIQEFFYGREELLIFNVAPNTLLFLLKTSQQELQEQTDLYRKTLINICRPLGKEYNWSFVVGEPVEKLSQLGQCYKNVRKALFSKKARSDGNIFYVSQLLKKEKEEDIAFDISTMDASKMDQRTIEKFLYIGQIGEIEDFIRSYFEDVGMKAVQSIMFRQYIILNMQFAINGFLGKIQEDEQQDLPQTHISILEGARSMREAEQYLCMQLEKAIVFRNKIMEKVESGITNRIYALLEEMNKKEVFQASEMVKNLNRNLFYLETVFYQREGRTIQEYLSKKIWNEVSSS